MGELQPPKKDDVLEHNPTWLLSFKNDDFCIKLQILFTNIIIRSKILENL